MYKVESEKLKIYIKIINFFMLSLHGRICIGIPKKVLHHRKHKDIATNTIKKLSWFLLFSVNELWFKDLK